MHATSSIRIIEGKVWKRNGREGDGEREGGCGWWWAEYDMTTSNGACSVPMLHANSRIGAAANVTASSRAGVRAKARVLHARFKFGIPVPNQNASVAQIANLPFTFSAQRNARSEAKRNTVNALNTSRPSTTQQKARKPSWNQAGR